MARYTDGQILNAGSLNEHTYSLNYVATGSVQLIHTNDTVIGSLYIPPATYATTDTIAIRSLATLVQTGSSATGDVTVNCMISGTANDLTFINKLGDPLKPIMPVYGEMQFIQSKLNTSSGITYGFQGDTDKNTHPYIGNWLDLWANWITGSFWIIISTNATASGANNYAHDVRIACTKL